MRLLYMVSLGLSCVGFVEWIYPALKMRTEPIGLSNVGNSCFMNAILQAMYITPMTEAFFKLGHECAQDSLVKAYRDFLINYSSIPIGGECNTQDLYDKLAAAGITLEGQQGDPHEMLTTVSREWEKQCPTHANLLLDSLQLRLERRSMGVDEPAHLHTPAYNMELYVPVEMKDEGSLQELMNAYFSEETLSGVNRVVEGKSVKVSRQVKTFFNRLPRILCVGIALTPKDAYGEPGAKRLDRVKLLSVLDVSAWCLSELLKTIGQKTRYHLIGVVGHGGEHYVSCVRYKVGSKVQWYICNDTTVAFVPTDTVLKDLETKGTFAGGYTPALIFYEQENLEKDAMQAFLHDLSLLCAIAGVS